MELMRALGVLAELPGPEHAALAELLGLPRVPERSDHTALFRLELPPYASIYLGEEGMLGGAARDRVSGFWGALGQGLPAEPDHLAALLGLYASIAEREESMDAAGVWVLRNARKALFWEHLACWLLPYLSRVDELADESYAAWARVLRDALAEEATALGSPSVPPLHFREAPAPLGSEADSLDAMVAALLAPVRSGLILTRSDLARMADALGTGARMGDRRFVLRGLLGQDTGGALAWLTGEAERQAGLLALWPEQLAATRDFWRARTEGSSAALSRLLEELARP